MESLKCHVCGKPAVVHLEQMVNGMKQVVNLCEACARSHGVLPNHVKQFYLAKNIGATLFGDLIPSIVSDSRCNHCGYTLELLRKSGNLGCPQCYENLKEKLLPIIQNMQKSLKHRGKQPKGFVTNPKKNSQKISLEEKLRRAIEGEHFEEAAKIRDQLRLLSENGND
ncbi:MAG: UvrB/UvrC motif-containing protein [Puniceicoccales bacterium]|jgi:protein arginine kinase activator|nr:UvrB/UvrC motif-containing protein [Puniceicoccales bacterium]